MKRDPTKSEQAWLDQIPLVKTFFLGAKTPLNYKDKQGETALDIALAPIAERIVALPGLAQNLLTHAMKHRYSFNLDLTKFLKNAVAAHKERQYERSDYPKFVLHELMGQHEPVQPQMRAQTLVRLEREVGATALDWNRFLRLFNLLTPAKAYGDMMQAMIKSHFTESEDIRGHLALCEHKPNAIWEKAGFSQDQIKRGLALMDWIELKAACRKYDKHGVIGNYPILVANGSSGHVLKERLKQELNLPDGGWQQIEEFLEEGAKFWKGRAEALKQGQIRLLQALKEYCIFDDWKSVWNILIAPENNLAEIEVYLKQEFNSDKSKLEAIEGVLANAAAQKRRVAQQVLDETAFFS